MHNNPIIVEFPLRGVWICPNTPGKKIPSHGTDKYGETYAYDLVKINVNNSSDKFYDVSMWEYLIYGVALNKCYGWGSSIYAPCDGVVVESIDGVIERNKVNIWNDTRYAMKITKEFETGKAKYEDVAGNYIIMKCSNGAYALLAHLQTGSITVRRDQTIKKGQIIGCVGHSGNSTAPHLHFQLMDSPNFLVAKGIPCAFASFEIFRNKVWIDQKNGVPSGHERIRYLGNKMTEV